MNDILSCQEWWELEILSFYSSKIHAETLLKSSGKVVPETNIIMGANQMSPP